MINKKRIVALGLALVLSLTSFAACKKEDPKETKAPSTAGENKPGETKPGENKPGETDAPTEGDTTKAPIEMDLGGMEIVIGDWWSEAETPDPETTYEEDLLAYRESIMEEYNFTISQKNIGGWSDIQEMCSTDILSGTPRAQIYVLDSSFVPALLAKNLFYDVSTLDAFDFSEDKWNEPVKELMTFEGGIYGFASGSEPRTGIFFNKRLYEEANLDAELPYDLQKEGKWDWDTFTDVCKKLTIDHDKDGVTDVYAIASFNKDFFAGCVASNGASFVTKNADTGLFELGINDPKFLEALQWGRSFYDAGYNMLPPEDAADNWQWFGPAFLTGKTAMRCAEEYAKGDMKRLKDDWGFVMFPKAPGADNYTSILRENVLIIPASYDAETANKIAFAYNLYSNPVPGYEDGEDWKNAYYSAYRDTRAVDETLTMMRNEAKEVIRVEAYTGIETGDIIYGVEAGEATPAEKIEEVKPAWQAAIDDLNADILGKE